MIRVVLISAFLTLVLTSRVESDDRIYAALAEAEKLTSEDKLDAALSKLNEVVQLDNKNEDARLGRVQIFFLQKDWPKVEAECRFMLKECRLVGTVSNTLVELAYSLYKQGKFKEALDECGSAWQRNAGSQFAPVLIKWIQSTCPDEKIRAPDFAFNKKLTLRLIYQSLDNLKIKDSRIIEAEAASMAINKKFREAVELQKLAIVLSHKSRIEQNKMILKFYEASKPYIDKDRVF